MVGTLWDRGSPNNLLRCAGAEAPHPVSSTSAWHPTHDVVCSDPMRETAYNQYDYRLPELEHRYGPNVHLLSDPVLLTQLSKLCQATTIQPDITWLVRDMYETMVRMVIARELPRTRAEVRTRMFNATPNGVWAGS